MKRFLWLPVLLLLFCGCAAQDKEFTFPENTAIAGVDVSGDTIEQADAALAAWPETYRIRVLMDGAETFLTAADLNLTYHAPTDWETAPDLTPEQVYSVTVPEDILDRLNGLDDTRKDGAELATMGYSETEGAFVVIPGKTWTYHDYAPTYDKLAEAVKALAPEVRLHSVLVTVPGQTAEDTDLPGVNTANRWLNASVTLNFPNGSVTVGKDAILPWISIGEDHLTPALDLDANWRTEFGGGIYLENGSHGCVNLPPDVAPVIYNAIDYGTAIILY